MPRNVYSEINLHLTWHTKEDLPWVVSYIRNQKKHHAEGRIHERLELTDQLEE